MFIPTPEEMEDAAKRPEVVFDERDFLVTFLQTGYQSKKHRLMEKKYQKMMKTSLRNLKMRVRDFRDSSNEDIIKRLSHMRFMTKQDDKKYDEDK